jgi:hypothetical protein
MTDEVRAERKLGRCERECAKTTCVLCDRLAFREVNGWNPNKPSDSPVEWMPVCYLHNPYGSRKGM